tara:strand:+ start:438 stop:863 length:426 start_codon:yes stop_codon:yes gene_type:complete
MANYCRSPVAEVILSDLLGNEFEVRSAGIEPMLKPHMDPRSQKFLEDKMFSLKVHNPTKVGINDIMDSDLILTLDPRVNRVISKTYPKFNYKYKLLNFINPSQIISDPFLLEDLVTYNQCMEKIKRACEDLSIFLKSNQDA